MAGVPEGRQAGARPDHDDGRGGVGRQPEVRVGVHVHREQAAHLPSPPSLNKRSGRKHNIQVYLCLYILPLDRIRLQCTLKTRNIMGSLQDMAGRCMF